jgi:oxygen-dependent protoporphyrinogen oxidase
MPHIAIVGGGISGLATAYQLQNLLPSAELTVLDANTRLGGTIWTEWRDQFVIEVGANGFLDAKRSTLDLCLALGLESELILASDAAKHRYLFLDNRLHRLPEGLWSFLRTPLLSRRSKWAIATERYRRASAPSGDESVHEFIARRTTREIAETLGDALVTGIHAGDPKLLSMAAAFPRIAGFEREHGSILRGMKAAVRARSAEARLRGETPSPGSRLLSLRHGLRRLIETLADVLRKPAILGVPIRRILRVGGGWRLQADGRDAWQADAVVLACPAHRQAEILRELDDELASLAGQISYAPAVVVALGYCESDIPRPLEGFGYIAPQRTRRDVLGVQMCSTIFPGRAPRGYMLLRALCGGWGRPDVVGWDDSRLLAAVRTELRTVMGIEVEPVFHHFVRWKHAIPQYHLGHLGRVARIEALAAKYPGLFLTGNAYHGVALNDCTEQAVLVARRVAVAMTQRA